MNATIDTLIEFFVEQGYKDVRVLADSTIIGTIELMYTRGLVIDLDRHGYAHRYCYADRDQATEACRVMQSGDELPMAGYIAERH